MKEKILAIIRNACALPEEEITENSELKMLSLDSLSFVGAAVEMEEEFGIEFELEELDIRNFEKVGNFMQFMEDKVNAAKQT